MIGKTVNNKDKYYITPYKCDHIEYKFKKWNKCYDSFISPTADKVVTQSIDIPCQKCVECRLNRSRDWANRLMMEGMYYESKYFLTLTYRDVDCPRNSEGFMTLRSKELQDFMKRLRWHSDKEIRFSLVVSMVVRRSDRIIMWLYLVLRYQILNFIRYQMVIRCIRLNGLKRFGIVDMSL